MKRDPKPGRHARRRLPARALVVATAIGAMLMNVSPVSAADIEVDAPTETTVGEVVRVAATITDGGEPIADAVVAVTRKATLAGESGFVELDSGVTDEAGQVELEFVQYAGSTDAAEMRIEYHAPDGVEAADFEFSVLPGPQQYASSSGADIGIINVSWLLVVLGLVWFFLVLAAWQLVAISRSRDGAKLRHHALPYYMVGFVIFTALGMFYVVLTQPTTHANLAPNALFDRAPTVYVGQDYPYVGHGAHDVASRPDDLSGEVLYVQTGCASCHGIGSSGAIVGDELTESVLSDTEEVMEAIRSGPKGMPVYSEIALSDSEAQRIIDYLLETTDG